MEFVNHTWFPALTFPSFAPDGELFHTVVLRQDFTFADGTLSFDPEQPRLCREDRFEGEVNASSVLAESDYSPYKPNCDILIQATAHAPGGRAIRAFPVRLRLFQRHGENAAAYDLLVDKPLVISGPSMLRRRLLPFRALWFLVKVGTLGLIRRNPWKRTRPGKIRSLPVRYEHAFGGTAKVLISHPRSHRVKKRDWLPEVEAKDLRAALKQAGQDAPLAWTHHESNEIGQGYAPAWFVEATRAKAVPAPQIEAPGAPLTARRFLRLLRGKDLDHPALLPQGLGIVNKTWAPRRHRVGTLDEAFFKSGMPMPADFDFAYWNCAPDDQQVPHLLGDEILELTNLCPPQQPGSFADSEGNTLFRLDLPGHMPYVLAHKRTGQLVPMSLELDTVYLNLEQCTLTLVWRTVLPEACQFRKLEARMVEQKDKAPWFARGGPVIVPRAKAPDPDLSLAEDPVV